MVLFNTTGVPVDTIIEFEREGENAVLRVTVETITRVPTIDV